METVTSFFKEKLNNEVSIETNINDFVYGLDAVDLMSDYFDEFDIQNSKDFEIFSFFVEEISPLDVFTKSYKKRLKEKKILRIDHLIQVAKKKEWFEPII